MKRCTYCGKTYDNSATSCSLDNEQLVLVGGSGDQEHDVATSDQRAGSLEKDALSQLRTIKSRFTGSNQRKTNKFGCHFYDLGGNYFIRGAAGFHREIVNAFVVAVQSKNLPDTEVALLNWGNDSADSITVAVVRKLKKGISEAIIDVQFLVQGPDISISLRHYNFLSGKYEQQAVKVLAALGIAVVSLLFLVIVARGGDIGDVLGVLMGFGIVLFIPLGIPIWLVLRAVGRGEIQPDETNISMGLRSTVMACLTDVARHGLGGLSKE